MAAAGAGFKGSGGFVFAGSDFATFSGSAGLGVSVRGRSAGSVFGAGVAVRPDVVEPDVVEEDVAAGAVVPLEVDPVLASREGESTTSGFAVLRVDATSAGIGPEFRPRMYPIAKNTPMSATTMKNTLISCVFPRTNSNSPSSFFGTRCSLA